MSRSRNSRFAASRVGIISMLVMVAAMLLVQTASAQPSSVVAREVEKQPFVAQVRRLIQAMEFLGEPFSAAEMHELETAINTSDGDAVHKIQAVLDAHALFAVTINPELRVRVSAGQAKPELVEQGWRQFLVKVTNQAGSAARLAVVSPQAQSVFVAQKQTESDVHFHHGKSPEPPLSATDIWLDLLTFDDQPLQPALSGLPVEYRIVQLYSRDAGNREAKFSFNVGQGTQDIGFRNDVDVLFTCRPAREIALRVRDQNGKPTTASFTIRDATGRVYPSQAKRLAPDFGFHAQVYRRDGETVRLPDGEYVIRCERGRESLAKDLRVKVGEGTRKLSFQTERWIDPAKLGWRSGDHHIHAAGCSHYTNPTEGVRVIDMARHTQGEDLKVGANLTWGPGFDYQKQFFTGVNHKASVYPYLLRYDVKVSGFGSDRSGHLGLLRLREQMYPGAIRQSTGQRLG